MKVTVRIDEQVSEPEVIVITDEMTEEVNEILRRLSETKPDMIAGFREDSVTVLDPRSIYRIYASGGKVCAETADGEYTLRLRLYEAEERMKKDCFVRISNSEIINLKKVKQFDLSMAGTICVILTNGTQTFVSRRFVTKIKNVLGM